MCWRSSENKRTPGAPVDPALCVLFDLFLSVNCISPWQLTESAQQSPLNHSPPFLSTTDNCACFPLYYVVTMLQTHICNRHDDIWKTYLGTNRKIALCCVCFRTVVVYFAFTTSCLLWPFFSASMCIPATPPSPAETRTV